MSRSADLLWEDCFPSQTQLLHLSPQRKEGDLTALFVRQGIHLPSLVMFYLWKLQPSFQRCVDTILNVNKKTT